MYKEEEFLSLSGIQHLCFCPRQCAFIHNEQLWNENFFTAHGRVIHEKVHSGKGESRKNIRIERSVRISSSLLGLIGQTDAVEFYKNGTVSPVEYKRGGKKIDSSDAVQLCAQAICLEEMLSIDIEKGFIFYDKIKKREEFFISDELRNETIDLSYKYHDLIESKKTPKAIYSKKCETCSFFEDCFPQSAGCGKSVFQYIEREMRDSM